MPEDAVAEECANIMDDIKAFADEYGKSFDEDFRKGLFDSLGLPQSGGPVMLPHVTQGPSSGVSVTNQSGSTLTIDLDGVKSQIKPDNMVLEEAASEFFERHFTGDAKLSRLRFGRHAGFNLQEVAKLDSEYLSFLLSNVPLPNKEKGAIEELAKEVV